MAEEYKRKWHQHHDPKADQKEYIGTKILDSIEQGAINWYQDERTLEGWEWLNPASVATAGAIRTVEGVGTVLAHTPGVAQGLQAIGKVEDVAAGNIGSLVATTGFDPRFGGWATRLASAWYGGKAITAASKTRTAQNLSKAAVKFGKIQADEIGMKASMAMKKKHGKVWKNPKAGIEPDPWFAKDDIGGPKKTYTRFQERRAYGPEYGKPNPAWYSPSGVSAADQLKARGMKRTVPEDIARRNNLRMKLEGSIDGWRDPYQAPVAQWASRDVYDTVTQSQRYINRYGGGVQDAGRVLQMAYDRARAGRDLTGFGRHNIGGRIYRVRKNTKADFNPAKGTGYKLVPVVNIQAEQALRRSWQWNSQTKKTVRDWFKKEVF